jgi:hypothetical protein
MWDFLNLERNESELQVQEDTGDVSGSMSSSRRTVMGISLSV